MRQFLRIAFLCILIALCCGIVFDPFWWYRLVQQREYTSGELWLEPVNYAIALLWSIFFTVVTIYSVLVLSRTEVPDALLSGFKTFWSEWVVGPQTVETLCWSIGLSHCWPFDCWIAKSRRAEIVDNPQGV